MKSRWARKEETANNISEFGGKDGQMASSKDTFDPGRRPMRRNTHSQILADLHLDSILSNLKGKHGQQLNAFVGLPNLEPAFPLDWVHLIPSCLRYQTSW